MRPPEDVSPLPLAATCRRPVDNSLRVVVLDLGEAPAVQLHSVRAGATLLLWQPVAWLPLLAAATALEETPLRLVVTPGSAILATRVPPIRAVARASWHARPLPPGYSRSRLEPSLRCRDAGGVKRPRAIVGPLQTTEPLGLRSCCRGRRLNRIVRRCTHCCHRPRRPRADSLNS